MVLSESWDIQQDDSETPKVLGGSSIFIFIFVNRKAGSEGMLKPEVPRLIRIYSLDKELQDDKRTSR